MATYQHATVTSANSIRAIADGAGSHFFDAATMRFFNSRLLEGVYPAESNIGKWDARTGNVFYFVTSERYDSTYGGPEPRHYSVRRMTLTAVRDDRPAVHIDIVEDFYALPTANQARKAAQEAARS